MKKFNLLDNVYFMRDDQITQAKIIGLKSKVSSIYKVELSSGVKTEELDVFLYSDINELLTFLSNNVVK